MRNFIYYLEYLGAKVLAWEVRILPRAFLPVMARWMELCFRLARPYRKLIRANISAAMPELAPPEVERISRESMRNTFWNFLEFVWMNGSMKRLQRCCQYPPDPELKKMILDHHHAGRRMIFINPHLGSWEASGMMVTMFGNLDMAAIAKPIKNPYVNRLLNSGSREKAHGLKIIFSRGAAREAIKLMKKGMHLGTLIDQNTRVRDGGEFLEFFGMQVASSVSPSVLKRYCDAHDLPAVLIFGVSLRGEDGLIHPQCIELPRPFDEYPDDKAVIQEMMKISESFIRKYPEQYVWLYKRFQHIPPGCPEEVRKRYPYYAKEPPPTFYRKLAPKK